MDTGPESRRFFVINLYFFFFVVLDIWNLIRYSHESWKSAACFQMFQNVFYTIHFSWVIGVLSMLYTSQKVKSDIKKTLCVGFLNAMFFMFLLQRFQFFWWFALWSGYIWYTPYRHSTLGKYRWISYYSE